MINLKSTTQTLLSILVLSAPSIAFSQLPTGGLSDTLPLQTVLGGATLPELGSNGIINPPTDKLITGAPGLLGMGASIAQDPASLVRPVQFLIIPVGYTLFPVLEVLATNPLSTPEYFQSGGTILFSDISIIPRIPLVNQPIN